MRLIYVLWLLLLSSFGAYAQMQTWVAGESCNTAPALPIATAASGYQSYSLDLPKVPKRWVRFNVPQTGVSYSIFVTGSNAHVNVFKGNTCETQVFAGDFTPSYQNSYQKTFFGWQAGEVVWLAMDLPEQENSTPETVRLVIAWEAPAATPLVFNKVDALTAMAVVNDDCVTAIPLSGTGTNVNAVGNDWNSLGGACTWSSTENSVFYTFEVTASTTPNPVEITLFNVQCTGGGNIIQLALYANCLGGGGTGDPAYRGCASGVGNVTITSNQVLTPGTYILAADGSSGAGCTWEVSSSVLPPVVNFAPQTFSGCQNSCVTFNNITTTPGAIASLQWTFPGGSPASSSDANPTVCYNVPGIYDVTLAITDTSGQVSTRTETNAVTIFALPNPPLAGSNTPVCVNGTLNLQADGGAPGVYSWLGPNNFLSNAQNPTINNATLANAGTYTVTFTNANSCSATNTTNVTVNPNPAPPLVSNNSPVCVGTNLLLTAAGPQGASYNWTGPNGFSSALQNPTVPAVTLANSGNYSATVTVNGCTSPFAVTQAVVNPLPAAPTPNNSGPLCSGRTLFLTAPLIFGATYSWTGPNGFTSSLQNPSIPNVTTDNGGQYSLTITDVNGCISPAGITNVTIFPTPIVQAIAATTPACTGGTLNLTAVANNGATFQWLGPNAFASPLQNPTISNITTANTGVYSVTVTENGCTSLPASVFVQVQPRPTAIIGSNQPICQGQQLNLTAVPLPDPNTQYQWTGPNGFNVLQQNPFISNAQPTNSGIYTMTITDGAGCSASAQITVTVNATPATPTPGNNGPICVGSILALTGPPVAGATYQWVGPNAFTSNAQNPLISNATANASGVYQLFVTVNGCVSQPGTTTVTVSPRPATPLIGNNGPICEGQDLNLTAVPVPGATYLWTGVNNFTSIAQNPVIPAVNTLQGGTYFLQITVNGCTSPVATTTAIVRPKPSTPIAGNNGPKCEGDMVQLTSSTVSGATYRWTGPNGFISNQQNPVIPFATSLSSGVYMVIARRNGCDSDPGLTTVVVHPKPALPIIGNNGPICEGATLNLTAETVTGASYFWAGENGFSATIQNPSIPNVSTVHAGSYFLTVTVNGCTSNTALTTVIVKPTPATPLASNDSPKCEGDPIQLNASTIMGATYEWNGPGGFNSGLQNPIIFGSTIANSGVYTVVATVEGCDSEPGFTTVVVKPSPSMPVVGNNGPICAGQQLNLTVANIPGASFSWTGPNGFQSIGQNPIIPNAQTYQSGFYSVVATINGCTSPVAVTQVLVRPAPMMPIVGNNSPFCEGGALQLTASLIPGAIYNWSGPGTFNANQQNPTISPATTVNSGTYSLTVSVNGCTAGPATTSVTILPRPATPSAGSNSPICAGNILNLTASLTAGGTYQWSGPSGFSSTFQNPIIPNANLANAGLYTVSVTLNGCTSPAAQTLVVINPSPGEITAGNNGPICVGATLNLTSTLVAGATYTWTGPNGFSSISQNPIIFNVSTLNAGVYTVAISLPGNCTSTAQTEVLVPTSFSPTATFVSSTANICAGQPLNTAIYLTGTGPWTVEYTANGVIQPPLVIGNSASPSPYYHPLTLTATANTTFTLTGVRSGTSCNGATNSSLIATVVPVPTAEFLTTEANVCAGQLATFTLKLTGKGPWLVNYTRNGIAETLTFGDSNSPSPFNIGHAFFLTENTTLILTAVTDANGCTGNISNNPVAGATVSPTPNATIGGPTAVCPNNQALTTVTVTEANNVSWVLTYLEGGVTKTMTGLGNGTFQLITGFLNVPTSVQLVSITNVQNTACSRPLNSGITIGISSIPVVSGSPSAPTCSTQTGSIVAMGTGGTPAYEFALGNGVFSSNNVFTGLAPGTYTIQLRDASGCTANTNVTVPNLATPQIISVSNIQSNQATVTWTSVPGAMYRLRYRLVGTTTFTQINNIPATTAPTVSRLITGLQANGVYEIQVQAFCGNLVSPWSPLEEFSTAPPCGTPTNVTLNFLPGSTTQAQVNWNSVSNAACYDLQYRAQNGVWTSIQVTDGQKPFTLPITLAPSTTYEVRMRTYCFSCPSTSVSPFAPIVSITTPANPCPTSVRINDGASTINSCGATTLIANFTTSLTTTPTIIWRNGDGQIVATGQVLTVNQSGLYSVEVTFPGCNTVTSQMVNVTIDTSSILLVVNGINVGCSGCSDGIIEATAIISSGEILEFEYSIVGPVNRDWQTSNKFFNVPEGTYTVRVRIKGKSCIVTREVTVNGPTLPTPIITSITGILSNRATINWNSVAGATSYNLRYRVVGSTTWETINGIVGNTRTVLNLQNNTQYEVQLQAVSSGGATSAWSSPKFFTTAAQVASCLTPGGVFATVLSAGSARIHWNNVPGANCYEIDYRLSGSFITQTALPTQNPFVIAGLSAGQVYQFRVRAICSACGTTTSASAYSPILTFTLPTARLGETVEAPLLQNGLFSNLSLYPNPNQGTFALVFEAEETSTQTLKVQDIRGRVIMDKLVEVNVGKNEIAFDLSNQPAGVYLVQFNHKTLKVVIQ